MATQTTSSRNLVDLQSITFIKPLGVRMTVSDVRPNTRLYPFFDGQRIDEYCQMYVGAGVDVLPVGGLSTIDVDIMTNTSMKPIGGPILSNPAGEVIVYFNIPGGKFTTGEKQIVLSDTSDIANLDTPGTTFGAAKAIFKSKGTLETYQKTTTNTTIVIQQVVAQVGDPLAQSFFTYGVKGGLFITSIDLFFQSKDDSIPVTVELREMENGYPKKNLNIDPDLIATVNAADVKISNDSSLGTKFIFNTPIYHEGDTDYCFVVRSNSSNYNLWTSKLGERALETNKIIFEQPYVGSLFKSENNITWTAEQYEDIKCNINKANFDITSSPTIRFIGEMPAVAVNGIQFVTTAGSNLVIYNAQKMHGLLAGSKLALAVDVLGTYNGISGADLTGEFNVSRVIDQYSIEFEAGDVATSSGQITSSTIVSSIVVLEGGSGYTSAPTVNIGAPLSGTTATATATILNGAVISVTITNHGSGYNQSPVLTISGGGGSGATALAISEATVTVVTNKLIDVISPQLTYGSPPDTSFTASIRTTNTSYGYRNTEELDLSSYTRLSSTALLASRYNENTLMSNQNSFEFFVTLGSTNPNLSPVLNFNNKNVLLAYTHAINNQATAEDLTSVISSSPLSTVSISNAGSGYSTAPVVTVIKAENDKGTITSDATITATVSSGEVTALTINTFGAGYTKPPLIKIAPPSSGITATASSTINPINSEIKTKGNAFSRYITKKMALANVSRGIRLFTNAISTAETSFDWYLRSSLAGDSTNHEDRPWKIMKCDVARNRSRTSTEVIEYEFYLDELDNFDTYDLKMVPSSTNQAKTPYIKQYRVIVLA